MKVPIVVEDSMPGHLKAIKDILLALSNRLTFADNNQVTYVQVTYGATPDVATSVAHGLGHIPTFFFTYCDRAAIVYDSGTAWTSSTINVKCNVANTVIHFLIA